MDSSIDPFAGYLLPLEDAVRELANTWHPDDPAYRAEVYRQALMNLSHGYFVHFNADAEHPDWSPLYNPVFLCQPNPDDIYLFSPIRDDLTYRVSGERGTVSKLIFVTQRGIPGTLETVGEYDAVSSIDDTDFRVGTDGRLEIVFSAVRPEGYEGNWSQLKPGADCIFVRYRMIDWGCEIDPQLSIECLDEVPPKPRLSAEEIVERLKLQMRIPRNQNRLFYKMQNDILEAAGKNRIHPVRLPGLDKQLYWPAVFSFENDEALIIETEMPAIARYWNIQLNDPLFNSVEYVYRHSSINGSTAIIDGDGMLRVVIALTDPGVPNWLDPAGFTEGTLYGRWYDCSSLPIPSITRVKLADLRAYLPSDTPTVAPSEREDALRRRVRAAQRRRRW
ncbi:hypothetical protein [Novosphingobium sp.]|uniref:hypothetical protein n=1 Tax=Novosphingobium sp. TaxID=1874826 RepID=UPI0028A99285|nr:hypothetical protein [Novosphingobium sp.]